MTQQQNGESWPVGRLLNWTRDYFTRRGMESPRLCAELLLAHAMGCERLHLYTRIESVPPDETRSRFRGLVEQAAAGKPVAYLVGVKEFFSLPFEVTPEVLIPRPETEILVERAIELARAAAAAGRTCRILDLCTGSGCVAIALSVHAPSAMLVAADVSPAALGVARRNAERHRVAGQIDFREGDLYGALPQGSTFDLILCNPPYVSLREAPTLAPGVRDFEPHLALFAGDDGLDIIRRVIAGAAEHLNDAGHLMLEVGHDQAASVAALLREAGWRDISAYRDAGGHARVLHARDR